LQWAMLSLQYQTAPGLENLTPLMANVALWLYVQWCYLRQASCYDLPFPSA
jgi:hypothetical protein